MDIDAWFALLDWHDGKCAICGRRAYLVIDHCHRCTLIRGLLCLGCNQEPDCPQVAAYRANPPAKQLGLRVVYAGRGTGGYAAQPDLRYPRCGLCPSEKAQTMAL